MTQPTILIVEDNAVSRRMMRTALEKETYSVLEGVDGRSAVRVLDEHAADLVVQDLVLPDMSGFELVARLRALPQIARVPIVAVSGFDSRPEEGRILAAGFDDYLVKPVQSSALVDTVRTHLALRPPLPGAEPVRPRRILLVDDDPLQLKLTRMRLRQLGFVVATASDGDEALILARAEPPDAIVTDILMPRLDGYALCVAVRQDPSLLSVPVVLLASGPVEDSDRHLAEKTGAHGIVVRSPGLEELVRTLAASLSGAPRARSIPSAGGPAEEYARRLEQQVAMNLRLSRRCALQGAQLAVLGGISEALAIGTDTRAALRDTLAACLDAGGLSFGALYIANARGELALCACTGAPNDSGELASFFGHMGVLERLVGTGEPAEIPSAAVPPGAARDILAGSGMATLLVMRMSSPSEPVGALVIGCPTGVLPGEEFLDFARTFTTAAARAAVVTRTFETLERDLDERRRAEAALHQSEARYRSLLNWLGDAVIVTDSERRIRDGNAAVSTVFGYDLDELRGHTAARLYADTEDFRRTEGVLTNPPDGKPVLTTALFRRKSGKVFAGEGATIRENGPREVSYVSVVRDVTQRMRLEEESLQTLKMEALGQLAGGMAHDFNNLLAVIMGYGDLLLSDLGTAHRGYRRVQEILRASERAALLTRQLLAFGRKQLMQPVILDLNAVIVDLTEQLRRLLGEEITLLTVPSPDLWMVKMDPAQLDQVIFNLVVNARDAMPSGGTLVLEATNMTFDSIYARAHPGTRAGSYVRLSVSDTGTGMDAATMARVFEPFFTTRTRAKGGGLGLSTVYGILRQSAGYITVSSKPGQGSRFDLFLPRVEPAGEKDAVRAETPTAEARPAMGTVLLVEDEASLRAFAREILEDAGYTVLEAADGKEAMMAAGAHGGSIDLVLSDIVMPRTNVRELTEQLRATRPGLRVLYMSGYAAELVGDVHVLDAVTHFLPKPFSSEMLLVKIREMLEPHGGH